MYNAPLCRQYMYVAIPWITDQSNGPDYKVQPNLEYEC